jgi:hypothetical protein
VHTLTFAIIILSLIASGFGLFYTTGDRPYTITNQYGDTVKIYGKGLYRHDSYFRAPIFRGTDFTILFITCPLLIVALIKDVQRKSFKYRLQLVAVITCFMYYAASIAFGVIYNELHLVYIMLFATSFFALVTGMMSIDYKEVEKHFIPSFSYKGVYRFLIITGIALFAAWLPDIITAFVTKRPLRLIENYTTEITYVIDMGLVAPACFVCFYLLRHRRGLGYVLLDMLLTLCIIIGVMLPAQTIFQLMEGITIPFAALITKLSSFCILSLFAFYFKVQLFKNAGDQVK